MNLYDLRTVTRVTPLGIDGKPFFSWKMESDKKDTIQTAYRLCVRNGEEVLWDTGEIPSRESAYVEYEGQDLLSSTEYTWQVSVKDNYGSLAEAESTFETALLHSTDWEAQWAESQLATSKRKLKHGGQPPATMFRRSFEVGGEVKKARLYATAHGIYQTFLNGIRPDQREFAPEFTVYRKMLCYQTYDVTKLLKNGENVIGFYVGDGWYACQQTKPPVKSPVPRHGVLFQLLIEYMDGKTEIICSDGQTKTSYGEVCYSDLFLGERQDARLKKDGWKEPGYDDSKWEYATERSNDLSLLEPQMDEGVYPVKLLSAEKIFLTPKGERVIDFGQNMAGRVRLRVDLPSGSEVFLDHFETLDQNGNCFNNLTTSKSEDMQRDAFVSDGTETIFEPKFTFHGFRYVRIQGYDKVQPEDIQAVVLTSQKRNLGTFSCSDERLNRLYENTRWSQYSNMLSIPTDCPQREKAGWTGDIALYIRTALLNEDVNMFLSRWLKNVEHDQGKNGAVPMLVPFGGYYPIVAKAASAAFGNPTSDAVGIAGWGDAAVIVPWQIYQITGNRQILKQQYRSMKRWCDYVIREAGKHGKAGKNIPKEWDEYLWNTGFHYGEWLIPSMSQNGYGMDTIRSCKQSLRYIAPLFGWQSVQMLSDTAKLLGKDEDYHYYQKVADRMKQAIEKYVIGEDGCMPAELMGAYVLPVSFGMVREELKDTFAQKLTKMIRDNGGCLDTGFLATPYLLDALCKLGYENLAYDLLFQTKCPSWLYEVENGATTIWESWYGYREDGTPNDVSLNHYAFGCVDEWIFEHICGIRPDMPGFRHFLLQPDFDERLTRASRSYETVCGEIKTDWERQGDHALVHLTVPCNVTTTVKLPGIAPQEVGSGSYTWDVDLA